MDDDKEEVVEVFASDSLTVTDTSHIRDKGAEVRQQVVIHDFF